MSGQITPKQSHEADGVDHWRVVFEGRARTSAPGRSRWALRSWTRSDAWLSPRTIPDIDLRVEGVTVRLTADGSGGLGEQDVTVAQQISDAARQLGVNVTPSAVQTIRVTIDALDGLAVIPFWRAMPRYRERGDSPDDLIDSRGRGPSLWFQQMDAPRPQRNRVHIDISLPHDQAGARVETAIAADGRLVTYQYAPQWWVLADAEGNGASVATWVGRE